MTQIERSDEEGARDAFASRSPLPPPNDGTVVQGDLRGVKQITNR